MLCRVVRYGAVQCDAGRRCVMRRGALLSVAVRPCESRYIAVRRRSSGCVRVRRDAPLYAAMRCRATRYVAVPRGASRCFAVHDCASACVVVLCVAVCRGALNNYERYVYCMRNYVG